MTLSEASVSESTLSERQRLPLTGLPFTRTQYVMNEHSLEMQNGILSPVKTSVRLKQVRNILVKQSRLQKLCNLSTIQVATDDPIVSELIIHNIRNGALFEERLHRCVKETQQAQPHAL